ncbi:hypothetical protein HCN44_003295 [Aphidius gifuensis]|uniref:Uncharacterized protein n=1 Tax=Aphidius gifuensis TaxID=684658 RepID=A0A834XJW7_APHGI|nr:uncharacterized protein LOC122859023 [Aphidius gifuensis]KAF7987533.1 hypothetical protein HCN44_003295 [Aphidius gifuensis]
MDHSHRRGQNNTDTINAKGDTSCIDLSSSSSSSDDDADVCILGEVSSRRDDTGSSTQNEREYHVMGCSYRHTNTCLCKDIINLEKRKAKLSTMSFRDNNNSVSSSAHSSILAGRFYDIQSRSSSETSYYSAQTNNNVNDKQITSETSSLSSNYSTDKWNKNIETSVELTETSNKDLSNQDTSKDKNTGEDDDDDDADDDVTRVENNNSITSVEIQEPIVNENIVLDKNDNEQPVKMNSSFLKKLIKVIDSPVEEDSIKPTEFFSRLSQSYIGNTDNFKRKLMTIMEENSMSQNCTLSDDNLTKKYVDICQYIQDESMPSLMFGSSLLNATNNRTSEVHLSPKSSPVKKLITNNNKKNINSSPLYKTALSNNATPNKKYQNKQQQQFASPNSPSSPNTLCGDSFIRLEKYCEQISTPTSGKKNNLRRSFSVPDFAVWTAKEEFLKKCKDQEKSLDDTIPAVKLSDDVTSSSYETFESHSRRDIDYHTMDTSILDDEDDLTKTIMIEVAKKRKRCYETEKTIREIDAASNASSETSTTFESDKILEMFELIKKSEDYYNYLTEHKDTIRAVTKRLSFDSGVDLSAKTPEHKSPRKKIIENTKLTQLKPTKAVAPRAKSPGRLTDEKIIKKPNNNNIKTPGQKLQASTPHSAKKIGSLTNLYPSSSSSSSSSTKSLASSKLNVNYHQTPTRSMTKLPQSVSPSLKQQETPKLLSSQLSSTRKSPAAAKQTTPMSYITSTIKLTPTTPRKNDPIISQSPRQVSSYNKTPVTTDAKRRFFITPNKGNPSPSPLNKIKVNKPKNYFTGLDDAYGYKTVKSPVAEYIRGTDTQLVQNVRAKRNSFLLTPKLNTADTQNEDLKFKLNKNDDSPVGFNHILSPVLQHQAKMMLAENEENVPIDFHLPQTNYKMPDEIHEIIGSPSKIRGARSRLLQEVNERKIVTRHEGRVATSFIDSLDDDMADMSIHVTNHANKTNYTGYLRRVKD